MPRSLLPALLLSLGLSATAHAQQWREYRPAGEGYRVEFPGTPTLDTRRVSTHAGIIELRTSAMGIGDQTFITIRSDYPPTMKMGDAESDLDRARNGSVTKAKGRLLSEERLTVNNAPARHLIIDIPAKNRVADALMVMQGHHLIQAVYVGPSSPQEAPEARRFLSSFALVQ